MKDIKDYKPLLIPYLKSRGLQVTPGSKIQCFSPDHTDTNPSCQIHATYFKCFGCDIQGDTLDAVSIIEGIDQGDTKLQIQALNSALGNPASLPHLIPFNKNQSFSPDTESLSIIREYMEKQAISNRDRIIDFLTEVRKHTRDIAEKMIDKGGLLYWPGRAVAEHDGITSTSINKAGLKSVHWNRAGITAVLQKGFTLHYFKDDSTQKYRSSGAKAFNPESIPGDRLVITEGELHAAACQAVNIPAVCAGGCQGIWQSAVEQNQAVLQRFKEIIILFDNDSGKITDKGENQEEKTRKAANKTAGALADLLTAEIKIAFPSTPGADPEDMIKSDNIDELKNCLESAELFVDENKQVIEEALLPVIANCIDHTPAHKIAISILKHIDSLLTSRMTSRLNPFDYNKYKFTEDGTARLIVDLLQDVYCYIPDLEGKEKKDYFYYKGVWIPENLLPEIIRYISAVRINTASVDDATQRVSHLKRLVTNAGINAVKNLIQVDPKIKGDSNLFDQKKNIVVFKNGTYDLDIDEFRDHSPEDYATLSVNVDYIPEALCPLFKSVVNDAMKSRKDDIIFLQKWAGYGLSGYTDEQCFLIADGSGENGKSTIFNAIMYAYGDYADTLPMTTLIKQNNRSATNDLAATRGKRFVVAAEAQQGEGFDESLIKTLSGEEDIKARFLYQEYLKFEPHFKFTLHTNYLPVLKGVDHGIWRRLRIMPFTWRVPKDKKNPKLPDLVRKEAPGILQWAIEGYRIWKSERLLTTESIEEAVDKYRRDSDPLAEFIGDHCEKGDDYKCGVKELYNNYCRWVVIKEKRSLSIKEFSPEMEKRGYHKKRTAKGNFFNGIKPVV